MGSLANVIIAMAAFVGTHFLMSHPLRAGMVARLGLGGFRVVYSLVSFATLGWVVWAMREMGPEPFLWTAPRWAWLLGAALMLIASILLVGSLVGNPALPGAPTVEAPRGVLAITRHPMMWGFAIWAFVHALVWPQPSVLVLAAGIAILALGGAAGQDAKKAALQPGFWPRWKAQTAFVPFTGPSRSWWPGWPVMLGGVVLWLVATWAHPKLGAPPVGVWS
ncbi:MAG: MFS transporter [Proteobacteria bacterium]|nr:MFS transporter [Pseudomonadota bacterium]